MQREAELRRHGEAVQTLTSTQPLWFISEQQCEAKFVMTLKSAAGAKEVYWYCQHDGGSPEGVTWHSAAS